MMGKSQRNWKVLNIIGGCYWPQEERSMVR